MKSRGTFLFLFFVQVALVAQAKVEAVLGPVPLAQNGNMPFVIEGGDTSEIILSRDQYVISYNKIRRNPNWVAWKLESHDLGKVGRSNIFYQDADLEGYLVQTGQGHAVTSDEYHGSCFDRGHQLPSADRTDTLIDNEATFVMANMVPQTPYLNRVIWEHLEIYTRSLVRQGKVVYVVSGPIYDQDYGLIGPHRDISIPSKNFKIIFVPESSEVMAVVIPNTQEDGQPSTNSGQTCPEFVDVNHHNLNDWKKYQTDVATIEKMTGFRIIQENP